MNFLPLDHLNTQRQFSNYYEDMVAIQFNIACYFQYFGHNLLLLKD